MTISSTQSHIRSKELLFLLLPVLMLAGFGLYFKAKERTDDRAKPEARAQFALTITCSRNGRWCASGGKTDVISLWNTKNRTLESKLPGFERNEGRGPTHINSLAFSADGMLIASAGGGEIQVSDVATGALLRTLDRSDFMAVSVLFSPGGRVIASGRVNGTVALWDVKTSKLLSKLPRKDYSSISKFSSDSSVIITLSGTIYPEIWTKPR